MPEGGFGGGLEDEGDSFLIELVGFQAVQDGVDGDCFCVKGDGFAFQKTAVLKEGAVRLAAQAAGLGDSERAKEQGAGEGAVEGGVAELDGLVIDFFDGLREVGAIDGEQAGLGDSEVVGVLSWGAGVGHGR